MKKECWNCKFSIDEDTGDTDLMCDTCENKSNWQKLKDNDNE